MMRVVACGEGCSFVVRALACGEGCNCGEGCSFLVRAVVLVMAVALW